MKSSEVKNHIDRVHGAFKCKLCDFIGSGAYHLQGHMHFQHGKNANGETKPEVKPTILPNNGKYPQKHDVVISLQQNSQNE